MSSGTSNSNPHIQRVASTDALTPQPENQLELASSDSGSPGLKAGLCNIPQEIVCYILHGESIYDIVSLAQTSGRFYTLMKTDRLIWQNAIDNAMLPLPTGHLLASFPDEDLFRIALRALSLHKAFQQTVAEPKRVVSLGNPTHQSLYHVPGGRWIAYERHPRLSFRDMSGIPIQGGFVCETHSTGKIQMEPLGAGIIRCVELSPLHTASDSDHNAYVWDVQFPQGPEPWRHTPRFTSELASIKKVMKCVFDARDSCLLGLHQDLHSIVFVDLKQQLGAVLDLGFGPINIIQKITTAHFHHTLPLIMLEYCHNERDAQGPQDYISLVDIPTRNPSSPQSPLELGEITWMEPITITEWTQLPDWPDNVSEVPETYDCMSTHTRFTAGKSMWERQCDSGTLCRKPNQELVIVKMRTLTLVYGPEASDFVEWDFPRPSGPRDQSWILAARFVSDDVVEVTYLSSCKRKTVDVRLKISGYGRRRNGTHVVRFDPIYGQLFVEMKGKSIMLQY